MLLEDVFTLQDVVKRYQSKAAETPAGEFITTIGPMAAMQFPEQRLPNLMRARRRQSARVHQRRAGRRQNQQPREGVARGEGRDGRRRRHGCRRRDRRDARAPAAAGAVPDAGVEKAEFVRGAELLRRPRHHDASRQRRLPLGRAERRRGEREHLHDAQPLPGARRREAAAGAPPVQLPAPGSARRSDAADAVAAAQEFASVLRQRLDAGAAGSASSPAAASTACGRSPRRDGAPRTIP